MSPKIDNLPPSSPLFLSLRQEGARLPPSTPPKKKLDFFGIRARIEAKKEREKLTKEILSSLKEHLAEAPTPKMKKGVKGLSLEELRAVNQALTKTSAGHTVLFGEEILKQVKSGNLISFIESVHKAHLAEKASEIGVKLTLESPFSPQLYVDNILVLKELKQTLGDSPPPSSDKYKEIVTELLTTSPLEARKRAKECARAHILLKKIAGGELSHTQENRLYDLSVHQVARLNTILTANAPLKREISSLCKRHGIYRDSFIDDVLSLAREQGSLLSRVELIMRFATLYPQLSEEEALSLIATVGGDSLKQEKLRDAVSGVRENFLLPGSSLSYDARSKRDAIFDTLIAGLPDGSTKALLQEQKDDGLNHAKSDLVKLVREWVLTRCTLKNGEVQELDRALYMQTNEALEAMTLEASIGVGDLFFKKVGRELQEKKIPLEGIFEMPPKEKAPPNSSRALLLHSLENSSSLPQKVVIQSESDWEDSLDVEIGESKTTLKVKARRGGKRGRRSVF